jgi:hypothetical protein
MRIARSAAWVALALALALAIAAPASAQTVNETFDRISGERTIAYTADGSMDAARPVVTFEAGFTRDASRAVISLAFVSGGAEGAPAARFGACHGIDWAVDGRALAVAPASYRGRMVDGEMIEVIEQDVTLEWALAVANGQEVRYRVCRDEYAFTSRDIEAFGRIAAKLKSATMVSSATRAVRPGAAPATEVEYKGMNWRPKHPGSLFPARN